MEEVFPVEIAGKIWGTLKTTTCSVITSIISQISQKERVWLTRLSYSVLENLDVSIFSRVVLVSDLSFFSSNMTWYGQICLPLLPYILSLVGVDRKHLSVRGGAKMGELCLNHV